jgi:PAS domain-containing protein
MPIVAAFSPGQLNNLGGWGIPAVTQYVPNPWGTRDNPSSNVWIQCTPAFADLFGKAQETDIGIGILEVEFVDNNGQVQRWQFGDTDNIQNNLSTTGEFNLPIRLFVSNFLSMTVILISYSANVEGSVTLFLWG